jgi:hypothetical protein
MVLPVPHWRRKCAISAIFRLSVGGTFKPDFYLIHHITGENQRLPDVAMGI